jgi:hypothetical protein
MTIDTEIQRVDSYIGKLSKVSRMPLVLVA